MRDKRPALILYGAAVTLVLVAKIFRIENLMLIAKPMVIPAIFYYYLQTKRAKINLLFSFGLLMFFIADMIMVVVNQADLVLLMFCAIVSYCVIIIFSIRDSRDLKMNLSHLLLWLLTMILPAAIILTFLNLQDDFFINNYLVCALYGVVLLSMLGISIYNYISKANNAFLYLCIATVCLFLSDLFYCVHVYMIKLPVISILNLITQLVSYFFIVRYFNLRKRIIGVKPADV